jgi:hypothetical protein
MNGRLISQPTKAGRNSKSVVGKAEGEKKERKFAHPLQMGERQY